MKEVSEHFIYKGIHRQEYTKKKEKLKLPKQRTVKTLKVSCVSICETRECSS